MLQQGKDWFQEIKTSKEKTIAKMKVQAGSTFHTTKVAHHYIQSSTDLRKMFILNKKFKHHKIVDVNLDLTE